LKHFILSLRIIVKSLGGRDIDMDTLNKILKQHAQVYSPHKQVLESLNLDNRLYIILFILIIEIVSAEYFLYSHKEIISFFIFISFILTTLVAAFLHFKYIENVYGSIGYLDKNRMYQFTELTKQKYQINLKDGNQNSLIDSMVKEKIESNSKKDQSKKAIYLTILPISLPFLVQFIAQNQNNTLIITSFITLIGLGFLLFSFKFLFKEYTLISKLEHINQILKEIQLVQMISNNNNNNGNQS
jgi:ABC-type nickel/cobalt efflux system permease component RcnA